MINEMDELYDWNSDEMLEISLAEPDDFLKIMETLTRIGVASNKNKKLYQSCHILHKQGRYYIVHFKEMFALDNKSANITVNDIKRRNTIAHLLQEWGLLTIVDVDKAEEFDKSFISQIKVVKAQDKGDWDLVAKYNIKTKGQKEIHVYNE